MKRSIEAQRRRAGGAHHPRLEHREEEGGCDAAGHAAEQQDPPVVEVLHCSKARHRCYHKRHNVRHLGRAGQGVDGSVRKAQPLASEAVSGAACSTGYTLVRAAGQCVRLACEGAKHGGGSESDDKEDADVLQTSKTSITL